MEPSRTDRQPAAVPAIDGPRVRFVVISDGHLTSVPRLAVRAVVRAVLGLGRPPAFVVDTGDSTELGWAEEIECYHREVVEPFRAAGIGLSAVPGNHEARWSPTDTQLYERVTQPLPDVARRDGLALLLLRSGLPGEQHGHLEALDLWKLRQTRGSLQEWVPTFGFLHHPILEDDPYLTGCVDAHAFLREMRTTALFVGHGHGWDGWRINGVHQFMTGAAMGGCFRIVDVEADHVETWGVQVEWDEVEREGAKDVANLRVSDIEGTWASFALRPEPVPMLTLQATPDATGGDPSARVGARWTGPEPTPDPLDVRLALREMTPVTLALPVEQGDAEARATVSLSFEGVPAGTHRLTARAECPAFGVLLASAGLASDSSEAAVEWERYLDGSVFASPLLQDGIVYCTTRGGTAYAVRADGAEFLWGYSCEAPIQSAPCLDSGRLFFGTASGAVHAVEVATGTPVWRVTTGGPVRSAPTVANGRLYIGGGDGILRCLDARSGASLWEHSVGRLIECRPAVAEGCVLFGSWDQRLHCLNAFSGEERWSAPVGRSVYYSPATTTPAVLDGRAFTSAPDNTVYAFDLGSGESLWQAEAQAGYTSPTVTGEGALVYGSMDGTLVGLDPATGAGRFRSKLAGGTFNSGPVAVGDRVVVGGLRGWLFVADAADGRQLAAVDLGDTLVFATPAFDGFRAVAGTMDGRIVSVRVLV